MQRLAVCGFLAAALASGAARADGPPPIKVGEINSYTGPAAVFTVSYRKGFEMAVDEINNAGGVLGRPLQVLFRDDTFSPAEGVRQAKELIDNEKVDVLAGTFFSPVALAVANVATQSKMFFLAAEPLTDKLTWQQGSRYVFRIRNPTYELVNMIAGKAAEPTLQALGDAVLAGRRLARHRRQLQDLPHQAEARRHLRRHRNGPPRRRSTPAPPSTGSSR